MERAAAERGRGSRGGRPRLSGGRASVPLLLGLLLLLGPGPAAAEGKECDKPCANGGRCQPGSGQCECQAGWVGDQCQHCGGRFRNVRFDTPSEWKQYFARFHIATKLHQGTGDIQVSAIHGSNSPLRPNVVITDEDRKRIIIVDVTVPFENRTPAFHAARARKEEKYAPLADVLRARGYKVQIHALIVGALGTWAPRNEGVLQACGVGWRYARLMRCLMVSDSIWWPRDIYIKHTTGHSQYHEE